MPSASAVAARPPLWMMGLQACGRQGWTSHTQLTGGTPRIDSWKTLSLTRNTTTGAEAHINSAPLRGAESVALAPLCSLNAAPKASFFHGTAGVRSFFRNS